MLYSEFDEKTLYRRFEIAQPIDVAHVTANVENGMLIVKAPKKVPQAIAEGRIQPSDCRSALEKLPFVDPKML